MAFKAKKKSFINTIPISKSGFLIDGFSYGGNSGSPVFTANDFQGAGKLAGMIYGHIPSNEGYNSGLAMALSADIFFEVINLFD